MGDARAATAVVIAADAPGWRAPGVRRFARLLHKNSNALVVVPDLARGDTWYGDPDPAKRAGDKKFAEWQKGHPATRVAADAAAVGVALRERGATRVGVVGVGTGANAVAALLGETDKNEKKKSDDTRETADVGVILCPIGLDVNVASDAASSVTPTMFVWGGGEGTQNQEAFTTRCATTSKTENKWKSKTFPSAPEFFAFAGESDDAVGDDELANAKVIAEWLNTETLL